MTSTTPAVQGLAPSPPGGRIVVLFDGRCPFCTASMQRLSRWCAPGTLEALDLHDPSVASRFPALDRTALQQAMHIVLPDGRVRRGMAAIACVVATRWWLRPLAWLYAVPGLRWLMDRAYGWVAKRRYRLIRRQIALEECDGDCAVHFTTEPRDDPKR